MAARRIARDWDAGQHPSRVRAYGADGSLTDLAPADWDRLASGPTLLFVHGTFSSTDGGVQPPATADDGRAAWTLRRAGHRLRPPDARRRPVHQCPRVPRRRRRPGPRARRRLSLPRWPRVARSITERPGDLAPLGTHLRVRQIVMVGVLNGGTILADAAHWSELLDRYTTLLRLLPSPGRHRHPRDRARGRAGPRRRGCAGPGGSLRDGSRQRVPRSAQHRPGAGRRFPLPGHRLRLRTARSRPEGLAQRRGSRPDLRRATATT